MGFRKPTESLEAPGFPKWLTAVAVLALVLAGCSEPSQPEPAAGNDREAVVEPAVDYASLVLINGGIYTVDAERSWAEAAAVRDGRIVVVGANADAEALAGPETRVIDLAGKLALPGFHDAHVHPMMGGFALLGCDLEGAGTIEALLEQVSACAAERPDGWLQGYAFNLALFGQNGPDKALLDEIDSQRPIVLWASDVHNAWVNSRALELAGISADTPDPPNGSIERYPDGSPSGTLRETAQELVREVMPEPSPRERFAALEAGVQHLNSLGITAFIDAWVGEKDWMSYQALDQAGRLHALVRTCLTYESSFAKHHGEDFDRVLELRSAYASPHVDNECIKLFLDGVLEGENAALLEPYVGFDHAGELILEPAALNAALTRFDALGLQVHMHAIGDRAVRAGLDAVEAARAANGAQDNRHHISHLQLIDVDDIERFAALDTTANFQALWAYADDWIMELNLPVLGEERVQGMYPIGSVLQAGGRIVGGSDWNVSSANPLDAIETAVRRQDAFAEGGAVLNAGERVPLAVMVDAYTINGAWLMQHEDETGSIEVGKRADIVILDRNLFAIPQSQINEAQVVETIFEGETVWPVQGDD